MSMESRHLACLSQALRPVFDQFSVGVGKGSVCEQSKSDGKEEMNIKDDYMLQDHYVFIKGK